MSEGDIHELREQAQKTLRNPDLKPVSLTMAVLAVLVAMVTLLGQRTHIEQVIAQAKASDQWSYYQAKASATTITKSFQRCYPPFRRKTGPQRNNLRKHS